MAQSHILEGAKEGGMLYNLSCELIFRKNTKPVLQR